jgi:hypothetical protein
VHVLLGDICESSPCDTIVIFDFFLEDTGGVFPFAVGSDGECSDLLAVGCLSDLWLCREITDELYFVEWVAHVMKG